MREALPALGTLANDFSFSQEPCAPLIPSAHPAPGPASNPPGSVHVETLPASNATQSSATLNAIVNPDGSAVSDCHFEYGATTAYGTSVPCASSPGSGIGPVAVSASVGGLSAKSTYHFRIVATNAVDSENGADSSFSTGP